jgi:nucleotide-binding universal stress UspA family protein
VTILCGTDFSERAGDALAVAAHLAKRSGEPLSLVHVSAFLGWQASLSVGGAAGDAGAAGESSAMRSALEEVRRDLAQRIALEAKKAEALGAKVAAEIVRGMPDEMLVARAAREHASAIVVGALGRRTEPAWTLGSTADRVAHRARSPVLVVRRAQPFEKWLEHGEPLRVLVGIDASSSCDHALDGLARFMQSSPCEMTAVHVYWPPDLREKGRSIAIGEARPDAEQKLRAELASRVARIPSCRPVELRLIGGMGRPADHIAQLAAEIGSDLVVVGTHQRSGVDWLWHGSVSYGVIAHAKASVLCIPGAAA